MFARGVFFELLQGGPSAVKEWIYTCRTGVAGQAGSMVPWRSRRPIMSGRSYLFFFFFLVFFFFVTRKSDVVRDTKVSLKMTQPCVGSGRRLPPPTESHL